MAISVPITRSRGPRGPNRLDPDQVAVRPSWAVELAQARIAAGLTLVAADALSGISFTTLSDYERGVVVPKPSRLARLMDLYSKAAHR